MEQELARRTREQGRAVKQGKDQAIRTQGPVKGTGTSDRDQGQARWTTDQEYEHGKMIQGTTTKDRGIFTHNPDNYHVSFFPLFLSRPFSFSLVLSLSLPLSLCLSL
jgi:hypothetical protein